MKKKELSVRIICAVIACVFLFSLLSLTVYAAPDGGDDTPAATEETPQTGDPGTDETAPGEDPADPGDEPSADPAEGNLDPTEPTEDAGTEEPTEEPFEELPTYAAPEHLDELDEVSDGEVVPATAVPVPQAVISDASLFSGIIMWLCVAVGIAVVVGVMVSRRTRRRGA